MRRKKSIKKAAVKKAPKRVVKSRVVKPFNAGTMSSAMFFQMIRSALRQKSRWWKPITLCKTNARRAYTGPLKRQKWEYQCAQCTKWYPDKEVHVDHIIGCGALNSYNDLPVFTQRLFCEVGGLQVLCNTCHTIKTQLEIKQLKEDKNDNTGKLSDGG